MSLDFIVLAVLALAFYRGWRKGIIVALFSLAGLLIGAVCALKFSGVVAGLLFKNGGGAWVPLVASTLTFILVVWLVRQSAKLVETAVSAVFLGVVNRAVGGVLYLLLAAFMVSLVLYLATGAGFIHESTLLDSTVCRYVAPVAPWVFTHIGAVLPFVKNIFTDLSHFFDKARTQ